MRVDFNNLRRQIAVQYNSLYIISERIKDAALTDKLENMRGLIAILLCCQSENEEIKSVDYELLPTDEDDE